MTVEDVERDYKRKVESNKRSQEVHKDAYFLGMIAAIFLRDSLNMSTNVDTVKEIVAKNVRENGHEDRLEEVLSYITEEKIAAAVPILAYRCFDYYKKREQEMKEAYERNLEKAKASILPKVKKVKANKVEPVKKKYVVKIHKR